MNAGQERRAPDDVTAGDARRTAFPVRASWQFGAFGIAVMLLISLPVPGVDSVAVWLGPIPVHELPLPVIVVAFALAASPVPSLRLAAASRPA